MKKSKQHRSSGSTGQAASPEALAPVSPAAQPAPETGGEPTVQSASLPLFFIVLLFTLIYWGGMYIIETGGQADARVHSPYRSFKELQDFQPKDEQQLLMMKGKLAYDKCAQCHQNDGNGAVAQNAPPLAGSEWVLAKDPSRIIRIILHGLSGPITVKGKEWGQGAMLAWKDIYSDEEIAQVLTYIRNSWGNKAPVVKADQVKRIREETKDWPGYMTVPDLEKVLLKE